MHIISEFEKDRLIQHNQAELGALCDESCWLPPENQRIAEDTRRRLLDLLSSRINFSFSGTKPHSGMLSPGCRLCGEGLWSCLFINNICNANCFYCPSEQKQRDIPTTNVLQFDSPPDYTDYLATFGFKGASISGGEPFLTYERTIRFVRQVKKKFGDGIYLWLYTNGILATQESLGQLADAGLDEVRYNIGATGFSLEHAQKAVGIIRNVTVEIPAVPERFDILAERIVDMYEAGIDFLNLHQIRCTAYNSRHLTDRDYTLLHGPSVGVLESELTALKLLNLIAERSIGLPVNYCALIYRNRYHAKAAHLRYAPLMKRSFENITGTGMIRNLSAVLPPDAISSLEGHFIAAGHDPSTWYYDRSSRSLHFGAELLSPVLAQGSSLTISYSIAMLRQAVTYRNPFREIRLNKHRKVAVERSRLYHNLELTPPEARFFKKHILDRPGWSPDIDEIISLLKSEMDVDCSAGDREKWCRILQAERIREGLLEYY
ncbi:MAG: radical SAM protein [Deltaproteobacteria bacterium]|nr:radical SAM protein [Deltaproteobacteria bacterium]